MPVTAGLQNTFNTVPAAYDRWRPEYPAEVYRAIFRAMPLDAGKAALEVGIGTGQATRPILATGCAVTAVELGDALAAFCVEKFRACENFRVVNQSFTDFEDAPQRYDLIYSASAFHWIPEEIGYTKVHTLLKPGGVFARFANHPNRDQSRPVLHEVMGEIYARYLPGALSSGEYTMKMAQKRAQIAEKYGFVNCTAQLFHRTREFTAQEYVQLLGTYSDHIALGEAVFARFRAEIEAAIQQNGGRITLYDTIDLQLARKADA